MNITNSTRTNWPRKVRELILDSDSQLHYRVQGGQGVGLQCTRGKNGWQGNPFPEIKKGQDQLQASGEDVSREKNETGGKF